MISVPTLLVVLVFCVGDEPTTRCREIMEHGQSGPDYGLGLQIKVL